MRHALQSMRAVSDATAMAADPSHETLRPYVAFHAALRSAYHRFIAHLEENCKSLMRHHLEVATSEFAVTALAGKSLRTPSLLLLLCSQLGHL